MRLRLAIAPVEGPPHALHHSLQLLLPPAGCSAAAIPQAVTGLRHPRLPVCACNRQRQECFSALPQAITPARAA